jgi:hypothetical protein
MGGGEAKSVPRLSYSFMYIFLLFMNGFVLPLYPSLFSRQHVSAFLSLVLRHPHTPFSFFFTTLS